jgi:hypothetical protein
MHALYSPLSDFGSYPRDCAGAKADWRRKAFVPDQRIEACLRETRDRLDLGETQECHIVQVARQAKGGGFCSLLRMGQFLSGTLRGRRAMISPLPVKPGGNGCISTGAPDMLHLCDCRISFSTEPTVGLFSATALARLLKMSDECVKQVRDSVKSN